MDQAVERWGLRPLPHGGNDTVQDDLELCGLCLGFDEHLIGFVIEVVPRRIQDLVGAVCEVGQAAPSL